MKFKLFLSCVAGLLGSLTISAQAANTYLAHVTNNVVDSGSCSIIGVNSGPGWASFKLTCGADVAYVTHSSGGGTNCSTTVSDGYVINGGCTTASQNSYTLYKKGPEPQQSLVWLTDVTNTMSANGPNCTVQSAGGMGGGGNTYVGYRVVCGNLVLPVTLTYNSFGCSVNSAPSGYVYSGGCNSYSVYKIVYQ